MRTSDKFIWISIVAVIFIFWWLETTINAPWWIISLTLSLGVLAWLNTHESSQIERYNLLLIIIVVLGTLYHRQMQVYNLMRVSEGYANGPQMDDPKQPNMSMEDLQNQIADLEDKLSKSNHHHLEGNEAASQVLTQFLSTTSESSRPKPSSGNISEIDLKATLYKDETKIPSGEVPLDKYTPAQAQRATFQLIDTVQQLKDTMENLTPVLKEGKQVMSMFEQMNLGDTMKKLNQMGGSDDKEMKNFMELMGKTQNKE